LDTNKITVKKKKKQKKTKKNWRDIQWNKKICCISIHT